MANHPREVINKAYAAFNERNIDDALAICLLDIN